MDNEIESLGARDNTFTHTGDQRASIKSQVGIVYTDQDGKYSLAVFIVGKQTRKVRVLLEGMIVKPKNLRLCKDQLMIYILTQVQNYLN